MNLKMICGSTTWMTTTITTLITDDRDTGNWSNLPPITKRKQQNQEVNDHPFILPRLSCPWGWVLGLCCLCTSPSPCPVTTSSPSSPTSLQTLPPFIMGLPRKADRGLKPEPGKHPEKGFWSSEHLNRSDLSLRIHWLLYDNAFMCHRIENV